MKDSHFEESKEILKNSIGSKLSEVDKIPLTESHSVLETALKNYLSNKSKYSIQILSRVSRIILRAIRKLSGKPKLQYRDIISITRINNEIRLACSILDKEHEINS